MNAASNIFRSKWFGACAVLLAVLFAGLIFTMPPAEVASIEPSETVQSVAITIEPKDWCSDLKDGERCEEPTLGEIFGRYNVRPAWQAATLARYGGRGSCETQNRRFSFGETVQIIIDTPESGVLQFECEESSDGTRPD